jgi:5-enolpyruvylshikimate-3-phosphate synthase
MRVLLERVDAAAPLGEKSQDVAEKVDAAATLGVKSQDVTDKVVVSAQLGEKMQPRPSTPQERGAVAAAALVVQLLATDSLQRRPMKWPWYH